jgi:hypothetical protein
MNAMLAANLVTVPRPVDADDTAVSLNLDGSWHVCWWRQGRVPEPFGPTFPTASEACKASRLVRQAHGLRLA